MERPLITIVDSSTGEQVTRPYNDEEMAAYEAAEQQRLKQLVPASITPRQCRLLLRQQGLLGQAEEMVAASTEDVKITWEYALEFRRDDPILNAFAANLVPPLTDDQIDQFFIEAAKL